MTKEEAKFSSFKVTVTVSSLEKVLNPLIWPEGIRVRKFFDKNKTNHVLS
jgi:hypothetical protein